MKFCEVIDLLKRIAVCENGEAYIGDIAEQIGEYVLGIRRNTRDDFATISMLDNEGGFVNFKNWAFHYIAPNGLILPYPFLIEDFEAEDWECVIVDCFGDYGYWAHKAEIKERVRDFLASKYSHQLLDCWNAERLSKELLALPNEIECITINAVLGGFWETIYSPTILPKLHLKGYGRDDLFEIDIAFKNGKRVNLAEWEFEK